MSTFRSRWDDWEPKEAPLRGAESDKSPSGTFGTPPPRHIPQKTEPPEPRRAATPQGNIHQETPPSCSDKSDKRGLKDSKVTTDKGAESGSGRLASVVLLAVPPGVPETWVQGVADLLAMACPASCPAGRWQALREDSYTFLRDHAARAYGLGWTALDLFGVHPAKPWARLDTMGLVPLLNGARVTALSDTEAVTEKPSGARLTFRRRGLASTELCLIWELET